MARDTLYAIGEALIDMIPSKSGCAFAEVPAFAPRAAVRLPATPTPRRWACNALRRSDIPAQNVHFLPYVTFFRIPFANFMIFAEKPPFCEKTLDSAHNFLYNKQRNNKGYVCL